MSLLILVQQTPGPSIHFRGYLLSNYFLSFYRQTADRRDAGISFHYITRPSFRAFSAWYFILHAYRMFVENIDQKHLSVIMGELLSLSFSPPSECVGE